MRNHHPMLGLIVAVGVFAGAADATAQSNPPWLSPANSDKLLSELKALIDKGANEGLAKKKYIKELRQLTARYDWPWSRLLMIEEFADGNYSANPPWTVRSGRFEMNREFGLVSIQNQAQQSTSQPGQPQGTVGQQLLGAVLQQVLPPQNQQQQQQPAATRGDIYTALGIANGFDIRLVLRTRNEPGRFEFGPYIAGQSDEGYRIVYAPGGNPSLALVRYSAIGSGVVETAKSQVQLTEGQDQYIQWFRHPNGDMAVYVNGKETIVASDRTFTKGFDGIIMSNLGGTYAVGEVAVYGTN
ncbi:MAG: hypothetical protein GY791_18665 [Alphaproteobacteria bacterium]|nr:hypothetical protein [Alphaproteobacteria bacterium]